MHTSAYVSIGKAQTRRLRSVCSLLTLMHTPAEAPPLPPPPQERVLPPNTDANASLPATLPGKRVAGNRSSGCCCFTRLLLHACPCTPAFTRLLFFRGGAPLSDANDSL